MRWSHIRSSYFSSSFTKNTLPNNSSTGSQESPTHLNTTENPKIETLAAIKRLKSKMTIDLMILLQKWRIRTLGTSN